jgi:hypothetical protein
MSEHVALLNHKNSRPAYRRLCCGCNLTGRGKGGFHVSDPGALAEAKMPISYRTPFGPTVQEGLPC